MAEETPVELRKRARRLNKKRIKTEADYVLCWLQQNIRAVDNPVIDAAVATPTNEKSPPSL